MSRPLILVGLFRCRKRLELMREMHKNEADASPSSPESDHSVGVDPFHDRFPWFRLVGRSYLYLSNLLFSMSLIQKIPIVSEKGDVVGYLRVAVQALNGEARERDSRCIHSLSPSSASQTQATLTLRQRLAAGSGKTCASRSTKTTAI